MYAAVRLSRDDAKVLIEALTDALDRQTLTNEPYHDVVDIVLTNEGDVSIEDDGVLALVRGNVIDYGNEEKNAF